MDSEKAEMNDSNTVLETLKTLTHEFVDERDWQQFHSPKNLSMSIAIEAAELMELFQWKTVQESHELNSKSLQQLEEELADVIIYCLMLARTVKIDVASSILRKMKKNARKYPASEYRGRF